MTDTTQTPPALPPAAWPGPSAEPAQNQWWRPPMRDVLAIVSTLIFVGAYAGKFYLATHKVAVPDGLAASMGQFDGLAMAQWAGVMGYFYGVTKSATSPGGAK